MAAGEADTARMTITDYLLDLFLIGLVLLQIRGRRITARMLLLPFAVVGYFAAQYLKAVPTAGNDLVLVVLCAGVGLVLGGLAAAFTHVTRREDGAVVARAGVVAAVLWVLGTGARFAFQLYATHGGGAAIGRFSVAHSITSAAAWTDAILLMAIGEVAARSAVLGLRVWRERQAEAGLALPPAVAPAAAIMDCSESTI